jgi:hypothetical protein
MKRSKLNFTKKTISSLSEAEQKNLIGGEAPLSTSLIECSGWTCCKETAITVTLSFVTLCQETVPKIPSQGNCLP